MDVNITEMIWRICCQNINISCNFGPTNCELPYFVKSNLRYPATTSKILYLIVKSYSYTQLHLKKGRKLDQSLQVQKSTLFRESNKRVEGDQTLLANPNKYQWRIFWAVKRDQGITRSLVYWILQIWNYLVLYHIACAVCTRSDCMILKMDWIYIIFAHKV